MQKQSVFDRRFKEKAKRYENLTPEQKAIGEELCLLQPKLRTLLSRRCGHLLRKGTELEDLVQGAITWIWQASHTYNSTKGQANTWIYNSAFSYITTIAQNSFLQKERVNFLDKEDIFEVDPPSLTTEVDEVVEEALQAAVNKLFEASPPFVRKVAELLVSQPTDYQEFICRYISVGGKNATYDPISPRWLRRYLKSLGYKATPTELNKAILFIREKVIESKLLGDFRVKGS